MNPDLRVTNEIVEQCLLLFSIQDVIAFGEYVIVIPQFQGFVAVNRPSPRA